MKFDEANNRRPLRSIVILFTFILIVAGYYCLNNQFAVSAVNKTMKQTAGQEDEQLNTLDRNQLQSEDLLWSKVSENSLNSTQRVNKVEPENYHLVKLDRNLLTQLLAHAPMEHTEAARSAAIVMTLPMPDRSFAR